MTKTDELAKPQKPFFLEIKFAFGILNFGSGGLFIWNLVFVFWNFRFIRVRCKV